MELKELECREGGEGEGRRRLSRRRSESRGKRTYLGRFDRRRFADNKWVTLNDQGFDLPVG